MYRMRVVIRSIWLLGALSTAFFGMFSSSHIQAMVNTQVSPHSIVTNIESTHPYHEYEDRFWIVEVPGASAIRVHFSYIDLEDGVDYLVISDPSDQQTQRVTGTYPDGHWSDPIPGGFAKVRLLSDGSVQNWGFAIDRKESVNYNSLIRSEHPYPDNSDRVWTLTNNQASPETEATSVHFSKIELEEHVDWLILTDVTGKPHQYITGSHHSGLWSKGVPGGAVRIQLITDGSVEEWGFNVDNSRNASPDDAESRPVMPLVARSDHPYPAESVREWVLTNPDPTSVSTKVHFDRIDLSHWDKIELLDLNDTIVQTFTGEVHLQDTWSDYLPGRIVKVRLTTTDSNILGPDVDWGFRIDMIAESVLTPGLAQSDHPYPAESVREWVLTNPDSTSASTKVHFDRIDLSHWDKIELLDLNDTIVQTFTGEVHLQDTWSDYLPGRIVKVRLTTTDSNILGPDVDWGFRIDMIAESVLTPGLAQSDHPYSAESVREWVLTNPDSTSASTKVHFDRIDLSHWDKIELLDLNDTIVQTFTGEVHLQDTWSDYLPGRIVKVRLTTTDSNILGPDVDWGFRIDMIAENVMPKDTVFLPLVIR